MNINKKNFYIAAIFGLLIGAAFTISAFTEPTTLPADTTSYPPINLGPVTQYHYGSLCFGDGTNKVDTSQCPVGSLTVKSSLLLDRLTVRQNANFVSDVTVDKRNIFAGALRAAQVSVDADSTKAQSYTSGAEKLYFPNGTTTNLISGNYCTTDANAACWPGTVLYKYDTSTAISTCRYINPVKSGGNLGRCPTWSVIGDVIVLNSNSKNQSTCVATQKYKLDDSKTIYDVPSSNVSMNSSYAWYLKGVNEADWTYIGTGTNYGYAESPAISVPMGSNSSTKVYDIRLNRIFNIVGTGNQTYQTGSQSYQYFAEINTVQDNVCTPYTGGTGGGSTGQ